MKLRSSAVMALILSLTLASPVLADCCDSVFGCAAAIVTEGLSCMVQEIISTIKNLMNLLTNLTQRTSGATQAASDGAQAYVNNTINDMTLQSQQAGAELALALEKAKDLYKREDTPVALTKTTTADLARGGSPATTTTPAPAPTATPRPAAAAQAKQVTHTATVINPALTASAVTKPNSTNTSNTAQEVNTGAPSAAVPITSLEAGHGGLTGLYEKAVKEIEALKTAADPDVGKVAQAMGQARQSEGPGLQSARAVADQAITAPLRNMQTNLQNMLNDPTHIFDPSDIVDQLTNSVMANLDTNLNQLVAGITAGPQKAFDSVQGPYDELLTNAQQASAIAAAMKTAYDQRTQASQVALSNLLPFPTVAAGSNTRARIVTGGRPLYAQMMATAQTKKAQITTASKQKIQAITPLVAQLKAVRTKALAAKAAVPTYQANFSRQLAATMANKTQAQIDAQRDQLIAQAKTQFASDPKTRDGVIRLLTSESSNIKAVPKH